jgi:hypothetical protein
MMEPDGLMMEPKALMIEPDALNRVLNYEGSDWSAKSSL